MNKTQTAPQGKAASVPVADRKPYNIKNAKATGAEMTEAKPISGFNGDILSPTEVLAIGESFEATLDAFETRGVDDDGKARIVYVMHDDKGEQFGVWHRGGLNLMKRVPVGTRVRVTYTAFDKAAKRPEPQHQFKIELGGGVKLAPREQAWEPSLPSNTH